MSLSIHLIQPGHILGEEIIGYVTLETTKPIKLRPRFLHANAVVPLPENGSNIKSLTLEWIFINSSNVPKFSSKVEILLKNLWYKLLFITF